MVDDQYRGLLTDREKEILAGDAEVSKSYYSRVKSRVRNKIQLLSDDIEFLGEHEPELAEDAHEKLCQ